MGGLKRLGLALVASLALTALGYLLLLAAGVLVGGWTSAVAGQQARALLLHFLVVAARGIVPVTALVGITGGLRIGSRSLHPRLLILGLACVASLLVVATVLPLETGPLPRLSIQGPVNLLASTLLLAAVSALGFQLADRVLKTRAGAGP